MYDENSMKSHIFWIKFKRVFCIIFFTAIGSALGAVISSYVVDVLLFPKFWSPIIVVISSLLFLAIANLMTANTGKEVQDSYWKIAVYKKLAIISKKLDNLEKLENLEKINSILNPNEEKLQNSKSKSVKEFEKEQVSSTIGKTQESSSSISEEIPHKTDEISSNSETEIISSIN